MSAARGLLPRQYDALRSVDRGVVNFITERKLPALIRRGLVVAEKRGGRLTGVYTLTDAGRRALSS